MDNKQKLSEIKICVKEIGAFLEEENQNIITLLDDNQRLAEVSWNDFGTHINFWIASVCNSKCYEDLSAFVREEEIVNSLNYFLTIKNLLNDIKANNYNKDIALSRLKSGITIQNANSQNRDFKQFFENLQARLVHFMPFIKEERLANEIKNISEFTTKKSKLDEATSNAKELIKNLKDKEKEITTFYNLLKNNDATEGQKGIKQFIEESHNQIKKKYEELFVTTKPVKIGDQQHPDSTTVGSIEFLIKDISAKQEVIKSSSEAIKTLETDFTTYATRMKSQQDAIDTMTGDTKKSLGEHVESLMVDTFKTEAAEKESQSKLMFKWSVGFIAAIAMLGLSWILGFNVDGLEFYQYGIRFVHSINNTNGDAGENKWEWIMFAYRAMIFLPLGLGFWFCNKKHDMLSLLAAEYRYKSSIVEAMIGYRARYETNQDIINFSKEYSKFFDKTFREINKNPADKINKMLMRNRFSTKDLLKAVLNDKKKQDAE